jgi:hypothetical protein
MSKLAIASLIALTAALGACTTLSKTDRELLDNTARKAELAQQQSADTQVIAGRALAVAQSAGADAAAAQVAAEEARKAAADSAVAAQAAAQKADRMFQKSLRK